MISFLASEGEAIGQRSRLNTKAGGTQHNCATAENVDYYDTEVGSSIEEEDAPYAISGLMGHMHKVRQEVRL